MKTLPVRYPWLCLFLYLPMTGGLALAVEVWSDKEKEDRYATLNTTAKWTSLAARAPDNPILYPERCTLTELFRLRLALNIHWSKVVNSELAYEQRARWVSTRNAGIAGTAFLPSTAEAPFRIRPMDWEITHHDDRFTYHHEMDRMLVAMHPEWGEITLGRQAIGLGRGVLFGAVDLFSPFSPLEVDREWRRGVDAARVEYHLSDTSSAEVLGVFGETWEQSALLGRIRGYVGEVDAELIAGKRAEDTLIGAVVSGVVADAEVHAELALFDTPEQFEDGGLFGNDHWPIKAVVGGSYTFDIGNGLTVLQEYHYCGFGVQETSNLTWQLLNPAFQKRLLRGDMQILGRHALATQLSYPFNEAMTGSFLVLTNPSDGSGVLSPALVWDANNNTTISISGFLPWGEEPDGLMIQSEYGMTSTSLFAQLTMYF
ncbi:MAG: hypothetical protein JW828_12480 [Sedimentisphaerales bacterium]|nr:hypothetical protein [Sedimentisphaerales bacterium]